MKNWLRFTEVNLKSKDNFKNPDSVMSQGFLVLNSYLPSSQFNLKKKNIPNFILQSLCRVNVGYTSAKFVLYLGTIEPRKNIESIISGFGEFLKNHKFVKS
jgi:glycosyltransferase involved in cell wall biosynthesis